MQKKAEPQSSGSNWESNLKKQAQKDMMKKIMIWSGIILACVVGLAVLVKVAGTSGPSTATTTSENKNVKAISSKEIVMGDKNAKIEIIEYADFQCPACASSNPIVKQILANYDGRVKIAYRFFPLRGIHKNALNSSQAAYAAWKMGKFIEMKDLLFDNQKSWENENNASEIFIGYAKKIGLDEEEFTKHMNSAAAKKAVLDGETEALALGLNSTPTFFIGKKQIPVQGYDGFKELIDQALKSSEEKETKPTTKPLQ